MATLKADIGEQAAEVHRSHKFNSGATEPTGDSSPTKLASGLVGTAEVMPVIQMNNCADCLHHHADIVPSCHLCLGHSFCPLSSVPYVETLPLAAPPLLSALRKFHLRGRKAVQVAAEHVCCNSFLL